ncbi:phosphoribosylaminoimidazole carboxylase [Auriculariales sp. MPI-PUGE-AT-0066]|nr:phosphoribosylaminoimidazole carboxylase [Auriculariales sp. MPI-PUGE-AT-0066]
MLALAAHRLAVPVVVLDPAVDSPAKLVSALAPSSRLAHVEASYSPSSDANVADANYNAFAQLATQTTVTTIEIEHVDAQALSRLKKAGTSVQPSPDTIMLVQDKFLQKEHLRKAGAPVCDAHRVDSADDLLRAIDSLGLPLMLKRRAGAYDGRGNAVVKDREQAPSALAALGGEGCYAERWATFKMEVAVMVVRDLNGNVQSYDPAQTIQRDSICRIVLAPVRAKTTTIARARAIAEAAVRSLDGAGVFGVELFVLDDENETVVLNELAPRVHNGGHWTTAGCATSQFENHIRAITGLPLGSTRMVVRCAAMVNLIGGKTPEELEATVQAAYGIEGATIELYGKSWRTGRKLGHINVVGSSDAELRVRLRPILLAASDPEVDILAPATPPRGKNHPFPIVSIVMGSTTDLPVMQKAADVLDDFAIPYEMLVVSAHRTPDRLYAFARDAEGRGVRVIIAGAGGAAHLPGMVAAMTPLPVIGVPVKTTALSGVDSLYSIVQMPRGIPVATVAIDNGMNGGLLAARMVGSASAMTAYMARQAESVVHDPRA